MLRKLLIAVISSSRGQTPAHLKTFYLLILIQSCQSQTANDTENGKAKLVEVDRLHGHDSANKIM